MDFLTIFRVGDPQAFKDDKGHLNVLVGVSGGPF